ncbi:hypothetical protein Pan216_36570 [Planctomycetes bacterium Pan216]|uniref:Uncharacterized protein n=1 Tax=Kolteria novifilia TaxID=2527975 RepID=A0A518B737_9BACT|nr:hypothetical protein Pan216_36570 [Planctomycetes bacterium Pan216]
MDTVALDDPMKVADEIEAFIKTLPSRTAVWWGLLAAEAACDNKPTAEEDKALQVTWSWVRHPTAKHHMVAHTVAQEYTTETAAGCALHAAAAAGILEPAPPGANTVADRQARSLSCAAVFLSVTEAMDEGLEFGYAQLLDLGKRIADNMVPWAADDHQPNHHE